MCERSGWVRSSLLSCLAFALVLASPDGARASDLDGDGFLDGADNCLRTPNPSQSDADGDGAGDSCDCRPDLMDPVTLDADANGVFDACEASGVGTLSYRESFDGETGFPTQPEIDIEGHGGVQGLAVGNGSALPSVAAGALELTVPSAAGPLPYDYVAGGAQATAIPPARDVGLGATFANVALTASAGAVNGVGLAATTATSGTSFRAEVTLWNGAPLLEVLESDANAAAVGLLTLPLPAVPAAFTLELLVDRGAATAVGILYAGPLVYMTPPLPLTAAVAEPIESLGALAWVGNNGDPALATADVDSLEWFLGPHGPLQIGTNRDRSLVHDGVGRFYDVLVPSSYTGSPIPLVVDLHGMTSNKTVQAGFSGWKQLANDPVDGGFAVAWPLALFGDPASREAPNPPGASVVGDPLGVIGPGWNSSGGLGGAIGGAAIANVDDVGFIEAMVDAIASELAIDRSRVYVTGISNGGGMTQRLACEAEGTFAAATAIASPLPYAPLTNCAPDRPMPVMTIQGVTDEIVPYAGGHLLPGHPDTLLLPIIASAQESFERWRDHNGCTGVPVATNPGPTSACYEYQTCNGGVRTRLCSITGVDQAEIQPGVFIPAYGHFLYFNEDQIDLAREAWDFMRTFQRPRPAVDGVWQLSTLCAGELATSILVDFEETGGGAFTGTRTQPCGHQRIGTGVLVPIETCSTPDPLTCTVPSACSNDAVVTTPGILAYPQDPTRYSPGRVTFDPVQITNPPSGLCGTPWTLAEETTQARVDATVRHVSGLDADRIHGVITPGEFRFFDDQQTLCGAVPAGFFAACEAELRPAGMAPDPLNPQTVEPRANVKLTFAPGALLSAATVLVTEVSTPALPIPPEFSLSGQIFYDIELEPPGALGGTVEVCLPYRDLDSDGFVDGTTPPLAEGALELMHEEQGSWAPVTTHRDAVANEICGEVTSFSQFVALPEPGGPALLGSGLLLLALLARRRRTAAALPRTRRGA